MPLSTSHSTPLMPETGARPLITIRPVSGWATLDLREVWGFRDLLVTLAGRDLKVRYKQTALGVLWVVLQPLLAAGVFSFVFGSVAKLSSEGFPYLVYSFAGLVGWNFFSNVLNKVSGCLVGNANLISKVFFPRLVLPLAGVGSCLVDFLISLVVMAAMLGFYRIVPSSTLWLFPAAVVVLAMMGTGVGLWTAALMVSYRDVAFILPVATNILLYASPVAYSLAAVPPELRWIYRLNPLTPPLEAMRNSLLGLPNGDDGRLLALSALVAAAVLAAGMYAFKRMERSFADVI